MGGDWQCTSENFCISKLFDFEENSLKHYADTLKQLTLTVHRLVFGREGSYVLLEGLKWGGGGAYMYWGRGTYMYSLPN